MSTTIKELQIGDVGAQAANLLEGDRMSLNVDFSPHNSRGSTVDDGVGR